MPEKPKKSDKPAAPPPGAAKVLTPEAEKKDDGKRKVTWKGADDGPFLLIVKSKHYKTPAYRDKVRNDLAAAMEASGQPMPAVAFWPPDDLLAAVDKTDGGLPRLVVLKSASYFDEAKRVEALAEFRSALEAAGRPMPAVYFAVHGEYIEVL